MTAGMYEKESQQAFTRRFAVMAPLVLLVYGGLQVASSFTEPDPAIRTLWREDLTAQVVVGLLAAVVAVFVGRWAAGRDGQGQARGVVGLAAGAVVAGALVWWSAAPMLLAAGAITLGRVTAVTARDSGSGAARALTLVAGLVAVASATVILVGILTRVF